MGKIVKFCSSCEEGFAEKFSFCPNCASELSAFEMKPIVETSPVIEEQAVVEEPILETVDAFEVKSDVLESPPIAYEETSVSNKPEFDTTPQIVEEEPVFEAVGFSDNSSNGFDDSEDLISDDILELEIEEPVKKQELFFTEDFNEPFDESEEIEESPEVVFLPEEPIQTYATNYNAKNEDGFHVTVVSEKGGKVRNGLLIAAFALIMFGFVGLMIYSLFTNLDNVASLNEDEVLLALLNEEPMQAEEEEKQKENKEDDGGGGGGGRENPKPASRGELPNQRDTLPPPPQVLPRLTDPSLSQPNFTKGPRTNRERTGPIGLPNGLSDDSSSGPGKNGGVGGGRDGGLGDGFGPGEGPGSNGGRGGGNNGGAGPGGGPGGNGGSPPPPPPAKPKPVGPTVGIKILSKPKPGYTDEARQNNVRGVVRVRVSFLANGSIGGVSVVQGLPNGLTEKALAAARQIRFEPPLRNGEPYSVNKVVQFNFNIY